MNDSILNEQQLATEILGIQLLNAHQYWFKKRLLFNILVGLAGFVSVIFFMPVLDAFDYAGILIWGIVANGLYSLGYVFESYFITKTKRTKEIKQARNWLFWCGTILYIIASLAVPYFAFLLAVL